MKKILLALLLVALITGNVALLIKMRGGSDMFGSSSEDTFSTEYNNVQSDSSADETTSADDDAASQSVSSDAQQDTAQDNLNTNSYDSDKLHTTLEFPDTFKDNSTAEIGKEIGNNSANAYNGGYVALYNKNVYYIDVHNSNYLYFARNNLTQYTKINQISSMYINVYADKIFYVNQADGTLWFRPVSGKNNEQVGKLRAVCPVAADGYIYYVALPDAASTCGEIHRMNVSDYSDEKISPDGYNCENIIPCGEFVLFVSVGKEDKSICALNCATSEVTPLYNGDVSDINFNDGALWFIRHLDSSDEVCKVVSGSDEVKVITSAEKIDNLIVANGYAFYIVSNSESYNKCARIAIDGNTPEIIYDNETEVISSFNVTDDFIYVEIANTKKLRRFTPGKKSITKMS